MYDSHNRNFVLFKNQLVFYWLFCSCTDIFCNQILDFLWLPKRIFNQIYNSLSYVLSKNFTIRYMTPSNNTNWLELFLSLLYRHKTYLVPIYLISAKSPNEVVHDECCGAQLFIYITEAKKTLSISHQPQTAHHVSLPKTKRKWRAAHSRRRDNISRPGGNRPISHTSSEELQPYVTPPQTTSIHQPSFSIYIASSSWICKRWSWLLKWGALRRDIRVLLA